MGDDLGQRGGGGLDVIATLYDLEVGGDGSQVLVRVLIGQVSEAKRLADLSGREELLELQYRVVLAVRATFGAPRAGSYLGGNVKRPIRDMEVSYNKNEESHGVSLTVEEKRGCILDLRLSTVTRGASCHNLRSAPARGWRGTATVRRR